MKDKVFEIVKNFQKKKILIIGDLMLDKYIYGDVNRISPEAPVQTVKVRKEEYFLGGAGNVANNIVSFGAKAILISEVGKDKEERIISKILKEKNIQSALIKTNKPTITKTRILGRNQQLLRIDYENTETEKEFDIIKNIKKEIKKCDAVIISDYAKGTITRRVISEIVKYKKLIVVDPKSYEPGFYKGTSLITPNEREATLMSKEKETKKIIRDIEKNTGAKVIITLGEKGMVFSKEKKLVEIPTVAKEVYDVTGAGDTVISALTLSLASGAELEEATMIANHAAGIVVGKLGTATTNVKEILRKFEFESNKIRPREEITKICSELRKQGKKIVFTNGCFDILHVGHIRVLTKAKSYGDILILGLNTDESIKKIKGPNRPIVHEKERAEMLAALESVDYVMLFSEDTPIKTINMIKPNIHVKGGDYKIEEIIERKAVEKNGGKVVLIPPVKGKSTTNIISKIKENYK